MDVKYLPVVKIIAFHSNENVATVVIMLILCTMIKLEISEELRNRKGVYDKVSDVVES